MFLRILDRLEEIIIASLMGAATLITFVTVVHRYLVDVPVLYPYLFRINLAWSQELCIYMFIWMAKFGAAYGVRTGIHVGVDVLIKRLNDRWRKGVILFGLFGGALFTAIVGTMGAKFVIELMHTDQVSPDLEIAELDRLRLHPARLLSDVLPLPSGVLALLLDQRIAASRCDQCRRHRGHVSRSADRDGRSVMSAALIFGLLFALMLTGMPISISLGLTVLTFLFTMTEVPIESVGLKLFSGLDNFGIMAIPFFILAGTFLTRGGVARRMIAFTTSLVGHLPGGLGLGGRRGLRDVCRDFRIQRRDRGGDRLDHDAGDGRARLSARGSASA